MWRGGRRGVTRTTKHLAASDGASRFRPCQKPGRFPPSEGGTSKSQRAELGAFAFGRQRARRTPVHGRRRVAPDQQGLCVFPLPFPHPKGVVNRGPGGLPPVDGRCGFSGIVGPELPEVFAAASPSAPMRANLKAGGNFFGMQQKSRQG